jgi:hypothetical protein
MQRTGPTLDATFENYLDRMKRETPEKIIGPKPTNTRLEYFDAVVANIIEKIQETTKKLQSLPPGPSKDRARLQKRLDGLKVSLDSYSAQRRKEFVSTAKPSVAAGGEMKPMHVMRRIQFAQMLARDSSEE